MPLFALASTKIAPERLVHKPSWERDIRLLAALAEADLRGRVCADQARVLDDIDLFRELALQEGCHGQTRHYVDAHTPLRTANGRGKTLSPASFLLAGVRSQPEHCQSECSYCRFSLHRNSRIGPWNFQVIDFHQLFLTGTIVALYELIINLGNFYSKTVRDSTMNKKYLSKSASVCAGLVLAIASLASPISSAAVITSAFTQTSTNGNHNDFAGERAVVSDAYSEDHRGLVEFNIGSLSPFTSATLNFNVFSDNGGTMALTLVSYDGNGVYSMSGDYSAAATSTVSSFSTTSFATGSNLSFDITSSLTNALANSKNFIGYRLARQGTGATVDFRNFSIVTTEAAVPEPTTVALFGFGIAGLLASRRKSKKA